MQVNIDTYTNLFINDIPLMDVRAPIEFLRGAFPTAKNLPIMDNEQREEVGTYYKKHGQDLAIQKGYELVKGELREKRIAGWVEFYKKNPNAHLYCYRGGLRSKITQQWINEAGKDIPMVTGGYKAMRMHLINELEDAVQHCSFNLIGGKTGSAKTTLINKLDNSIDLEAAAHHRGSSFGRHVIEQNSQINFENIIAINFLKLRHKKIDKVIIEDEARTIGKVGIPKKLFEKMRQSPIVVIDEPIAARLERIVQEYIIEMLVKFTEKNGERDGFNLFSMNLFDSLKRIQRRLGPARYNIIRKNLHTALTIQRKTGDIAKHYDWLTVILENYYDPMYEDQLKQRKEFICFYGSYNACLQFIQQQNT